MAISKIKLVPVMKFDTYEEYVAKQPIKPEANKAKEGAKALFGGGVSLDNVPEFKLPLNELIIYINDYIKFIDNWAMVDSIVSNLKVFKKYEKEVFELAKNYINSKEEFEIRFGYCILLSYYICAYKEQYIDAIFSLCNKSHPMYYVQMMVAWLLSISYIKFKEKTYQFLLSNKLDNFTFNKTISKICDSYRISKEEKQQLKYLRRK